MEALANYLQDMSEWERILILAGGIVLFWILEGAIPLVRFKYEKVRHAALNLFFLLTTIMVNILFAAMIVFASDTTSENRWGLLHVVDLPLWLFALLGLLLLDLIGAWFIHWLQHRVRWMWKFHVVHHSDTWVDTTTANRHHPGESVFRSLLTLVAVIIAGAPFWLVILYQSLSVFFAQFNHANISLPKALDRALSWVIVSPNMHKVHHHYARPWTDSNYGNIFSIWDRLFGTFVYVPETASLRYGIDTEADNEEHTRIGGLLRFPFAK